MTMAEVRVKEWGNSYGVILPKDLVKHMEINKGDTIKIDIIKKRKIDGFGMLRGIGKFEEEEISHEEF